MRPRETGPLEVSLDLFVHLRETEGLRVETNARRPAGVGPLSRDRRPIMPNKG
jgi:hypothetical protein